MWGAYLKLLTHALVSPDLISDDDPELVHTWERKVHNHLKTAGERLTAAGHRLATVLPARGADPELPEGGVTRLFAANNLIKWVDRPGSAEADGHEEVEHACETFGVDPLALVRVAYKKGGFDRLQLPEQNDKLEPIVALFHACFPVDGQWGTVRAAVAQWLKLSQDCPAHTRAAFQACFVLTRVPNAHYAALLEDARQHRFEPRADAAIRHAMNAKHVPRRVPPKSNPKFTAHPRALFENGPGGPVAEEVSVGSSAGPIGPDPSAEHEPADPARGGSSRNTGAGKGVWAVIGIGLATIVASVVVVVLTLNRDPEPTAEPRDAARSDQGQAQKVEPKKEEPKKEEPKKEEPKKEAKKEEPKKEEPKKETKKEEPKKDPKVDPPKQPEMPEPKVPGVAPPEVKFPEVKLPEPRLLGPGEPIPNMLEPKKPELKQEPEPKKEPPKTDAKTVIDSVNPVVPKLMRKLQRLRLWN